MTNFGHMTISHLLSVIYNAIKFMTKKNSHLLVVLIGQFGSIFNSFFSN